MTKGFTGFATGAVPEVGLVPASVGKNPLDGVSAGARAELEDDETNTCGFEGRAESGGEFL